MQHQDPSSAAAALTAPGVRAAATGAGSGEPSGASPLAGPGQMMSLAARASQANMQPRQQQPSAVQLPTKRALGLSPSLAPPAKRQCAKQSPALVLSGGWTRVGASATAAVPAGALAAPATVQAATAGARVSGQTTAATPATVQPKTPQAGARRRLMSGTRNALLQHQQQQAERSDAAAPGRSASVGTAAAAAAIEAAAGAGPGLGARVAEPAVKVEPADSAGEGGKAPLCRDGADSEPVGGSRAGSFCHCEKLCAHYGLAGSVTCKRAQTQIWPHGFYVSRRRLERMFGSQCPPPPAAACYVSKCCWGQLVKVIEGHRASPAEAPQPLREEDAPGLPRQVRLRSALELQHAAGQQYEAGGRTSTAVPPPPPAAVAAAQPAAAPRTVAATATEAGAGGAAAFGEPGVVHHTEVAPQPRPAGAVAAAVQPAVQSETTTAAEATETGLLRPEPDPAGPATGAAAGIQQQAREAATRMASIGESSCSDEDAGVQQEGRRDHGVGDSVGGQSDPDGGRDQRPEGRVCNCRALCLHYGHSYMLRCAEPLVARRSGGRLCGMRLSAQRLERLFGSNHPPPPADSCFVSLQCWAKLARVFSSGEVLPSSVTSSMPTPPLLGWQPVQLEASYGPALTVLHVVKYGEMAVPPVGAAAEATGTVGDGAAAVEAREDSGGTGTGAEPAVASGSGAGGGGGPNSSETSVAAPAVAVCRSQWSKWGLRKVAAGDAVILTANTASYEYSVCIQPRQRPSSAYRVSACAGGRKGCCVFALARVRRVLERATVTSNATGATGTAAAAGYPLTTAAALTSSDDQDQLWVELDPGSWVWLDNVPWEQITLDSGMAGTCRSMRRLTKTPALQHYADAVEGLLQSAAARGAAGATTSAAVNSGAAGEGMQPLPTLPPHPCGHFLRSRNKGLLHSTAAVAAVAAAGGEGGAPAAAASIGGVDGGDGGPGLSHCATAAAAPAGVAPATAGHSNAGAQPAAAAAHPDSPIAVVEGEQHGVDCSGGPRVMSIGWAEAMRYEQEAERRAGAIAAARAPAEHQQRGTPLRQQSQQAPTGAAGVAVAGNAAWQAVLRPPPLVATGAASAEPAAGAGAVAAAADGPAPAVASKSSSASDGDEEKMVEDPDDGSGSGLESDPDDHIADARSAPCGARRACNCQALCRHYGCTDKLSCSKPWGVEPGKLSRGFSVSSEQLGRMFGGEAPSPPESSRFVSVPCWQKMLRAFGGLAGSKEGAGNTRAGRRRQVRPASGSVVVPPMGLQLQPVQLRASDGPALTVLHVTNYAHMAVPTAGAVSGAAAMDGEGNGVAGRGAESGAASHSSGDGGGSAVAAPAVAIRMQQWHRSRLDKLAAGDAAILTINTSLSKYAQYIRPHQRLAGLEGSRRYSCCAFALTRVRRVLEPAVTLTPGQDGAVNNGGGPDAASTATGTGAAGGPSRISTQLTTGAGGSSSTALNEMWVELDPSSWVWLSNVPWVQIALDLGTHAACQSTRRVDKTPALQHYADAVEGLLQSAAARGAAGASTSAVANGGAVGEGMQLLPTLLPYPGGGFLQYHSAVPQANLQEPPAATTAGADRAAMGRCSLAIAGRRDSTSSDHCALRATASAAAVGLALGTGDCGDAGALPLGTGAHLHAATAAGPEAQEGLDIGAGGGRQQPAAAAEPVGIHDAAAARPDGTAGAAASPPVPCLAGRAGGPAVAQAQAPGPPAAAAGAAGIDLPTIGFGITAPYSSNAVAARAAAPTPEQQQQQPQHCAAGQQDEDWVDAVVQDLDRRVSWTAATNHALVQTAVTVRLQADAAVAEAARRLAAADVQHQRELQAAREQAARELATAANQRDAADTAKAAAERQLEEVMRERDAALAQRDEAVLQLQRERKEMRRQMHSAVMAAANAAHEQVARADQERRAAQALNDKLRLALAKTQQALLPPPPSWQGPQQQPGQ